MLIKRNIPLMYFILALDSALFWIAIWVLFYLHFTNYAGIGIIESVMILTTFVAEIPTGAIADLFGKRKTLMIAFMLGAVGNFLMGFSQTFNALLISVFIMTIGGVLRSGTAEALIYDSLLTLKQQHKYERILGNISTIKMITIAFSSIVGGYLFTLNIGFPFIALGIVRLIAVGVTTLLVEPPIDSEIFNFNNYVKQATNGIKELFRTKYIAISSLLIIVFTTITLINGHLFIDAQLAARGWSGRELGFISSVMFLLSAGIAQFTSVLSSKFGRQMANIIIVIFIAITMLLVPILGTVFATIVIISRNGLLEIFGNTANTIINNNVRSKYRATAISSYSMLSSIPYVLVAFWIGKWIDMKSADTVVLYFGVILLFFGVVGYLTFVKYLKSYEKKD